MKIVVLVKEVPDTYGDRKLDLETGLADRGASDTVIDEIGERSLEVALAYAEKNPGTEVVALSMTPETATAMVRKALAMGATSALHVADAALAGADLGLTAEVLAAALRRAEGDVVITGNQSTDGSGGVMASMLAELLDLPCVTNLSTVELSDDTVTGERAIDGATMTATAILPAVISITEQLPDARFPNFKGIMAAKKKPLEVVSIADLGIDVNDFSVPRAIMTAISEKPPRSAGTKITDDGDAGNKLAAFLLDNRLV